MSRSKANPQLANELSHEAFGTSLHERQKETYAPIPLAHIQAAAKIVRRSGVLELITTWKKEERARNCDIRPDGEAPGVKRVISIKVLLILMLLHVMEGRGVLFNDMAQTLTYRVRKKDFEELGLTNSTGTYKQWYYRLLNTKDHLEDLVDPLPGNRRETPTDEQIVEIMRDRERRAGELRVKERRLNLLLNDLVESSVQMLGKSIRDRYRGNVALDATKIRMWGQAGVDRQRLDALLAEKGLDIQNENDLDEIESGTKRKSRRGGELVQTSNYDAGFYRRDGNHDGTNSSRDIREWALELELAVMTANRPGEKADFPLLAIGVGHHRPGKTRGAGLGVLRDLQRRKYEAWHLIVDMGYLPVSTPENLQGPARDMGWIPVFNYRRDQLGKTDYYEDLIQVEGQWYLNLMPEELINAEKDYRDALRDDRMKKRDLRMSRKAKDSLRQIRDERRAERENYRVKAKGRPDADGSQRFQYPDPDNYLAFDSNTGEELLKPTRSTRTIPRDAGLKYGQKYLHRGRKWQDYYGLRNTVEAFNSYVKQPLHTDIEDPATRQARGNTFAALVAILAIITANVRKIETFIMELHRGEASTSSNKYEVIEAVQLEELEELNMIEADLFADGFEPPPR